MSPLKVDAPCCRSCGRSLQERHRAQHLPHLRSVPVRAGARCGNQQGSVQPAGPAAWRGGAQGQGGSYGRAGRHSQGKSPGAAGSISCCSQSRLDSCVCWQTSIKHLCLAWPGAALGACAGASGSVSSVPSVLSALLPAVTWLPGTQQKRCMRLHLMPLLAPALISIGAAAAAAAAAVCCCPLLPAAAASTEQARMNQP